MASSPLRGSGLVVGGLVAQEIGASIGVLLFPAVGPLGVVAYRVAIAAVVLGVLVRPRWRGHTAVAWRRAVGYGLVLAGMNLAFSLSLQHLDLGVAVTVEVLGPLAVSLLTRRRASSAAIAVAALAGVALIGLGAPRFDLPGVALALAAAALWACYILLARGIGRSFPGLSGVTIGMAVAGVVVGPAALVAIGPPLLEPRTLALGAAVAVLSSAVPYTAELLALRLLPAAAVSVLLTLAPAIAAIAGLLLLGQRLGPPAWAGLTLVIAASAAAVRLSGPEPPPVAP